MVVKCCTPVSKQEMFSHWQTAPFHTCFAVNLSALKQTLQSKCRNVMKKNGFGDYPPVLQLFGVESHKDKWVLKDHFIVWNISCCKPGNSPGSRSVAFLLLIVWWNRLWFIHRLWQIMTVGHCIWHRGKLFCLFNSVTDNTFSSLCKENTDRLNVW